MDSLSLLSTLLILMVSTHAPLIYCNRNRHIKNAFINPSQTAGFSHLARDSRTGIIYIGATNKLFKLDKALEVNQTVTTGPKLDSVNCFQLDSCSSLIYMNSYNKALLVDEENKWLITCTSLFHGQCEHRSPDNMTMVKDVESVFNVVANNATATTVMFIGQGPSETSNRGKVLYVGKQYTNLGKIRIPFGPAVSMRSLDSFKIFSKTLSSSSAINVDSVFRDGFPIFYEYGFSSGGFSYFATVQKENVKAKNFVSKLIRVCQNDKNFYSYMENKIQCSHSGSQYKIIHSAVLGKPGLLLASYLGIQQSEDVLFATFQSALVKHSEAVFCVFSMRDIRKIFTRNIKRCFSGFGTTGPDHVTHPNNCISAGGGLTDSINDDYCGQFEFNMPIDGYENITAEAIMKLDTEVTSLSVYTANKHTILYAGSIRGTIYQILLNNSTGYIFNSYELEQGNIILQDTAFDDDVEYIYALTPRTVYRLALSTCEYYNNCDRCIENPHCGWCTLEARCTKSNECAGNEIPTKWIGYNSVCVRITDTNPSVFSVNKDNEKPWVTMITTSLPYGEQYNCAYKDNGEEIITTLNQTDSKYITCEFPETDKIPKIARDGIIIQLVVQFEKKDIVGTDITFFNCSAYIDCTSCTSSRFSCSWCINNNECTHRPNLNCDFNDNVVLGLNSNYTNKNNSGSLGPSNCPQFKRDSDIYMASNHSKNVSVTAYNILPHQLPLRCHFGFDGGKLVSTKSFPTANSTLRIQCDEVQIKYTENVKSKTIPFKIIWGDQKSPKIIDNSNKVKVVLYKCPFLGPTCGECLSLPKHYQCGWCYNRCEVKADCLQEDWHIKPYVCPIVQITEMHPVSGHYRGNTHLTIEGINLGTSISEVTFIKVVNVPCIPMEQNYIPSKRIVCKTGAYDKFLPGSGQVNILIADKYNASSKNNFIFTDPIVRLITPLIGPSSGRTHGMVFGEYLDTGNEMKIIIDNKISGIFQRNETSVTFLTPNHEEGDKEIFITIDGHELTNWTNVDNVFSYEKDPTIESISPRKSFFAGFMDQMVIGTNVNSVAKPSMFVTYLEDREVYRSVDTGCKTTNKSIMVCPSPPIEVSNLNRTVIKASCSFVMDGVMSVQNMSVYFPNVDAEISYYKDPVVALQASIFKDKLIIKGEFLGVIEMAVPVNITLGDDYCSVTVILVNEIQCKVPLNIDRSGKIKVSINNGMFEFYPELPKEPTADDSFNPSTVIAIFASLFMVVFLSILIPVLLMKRRNIKRKASIMSTERFQDIDNYQLLVQNNPEKIGMAIPEETLETIIRFGLHIERKYLEMMETLGEGQFGLVYKGRLQFDGVEQRDVAVKTVKGDNSDSIKQILEEALLMKDFNHENVISIIGIAISEKNLPFIVMPYMKHGDLLSYLRNESNSPTVAVLVNFGLDIAKGMNYLSMIKYVHRDLAARNCMLDAKLVAKVGDFGLSRDIYSTDYYTCDNKKKLPYRWMAPESMEDGKCSEKTDVWSFGVVLWELMTRGSTPYTGVGNWEILSCLKDGMRLPRPMYCPVPLYEVMLRCWNYDSTVRPTFSVLETEISDLISTNMKNKTVELLTDESYESPVDIKKCRYYYNAPGCKNQNQSYIEILPEQQQNLSNEKTEND